MTKLLRLRISTDAQDRWFSWSVGFLGMSVVTALILKALPLFGLGMSTLLVFSLAVGWRAIGLLFPRSGGA
jgi:hypothetical protein